MPRKNGATTVTTAEGWKGLKPLTEFATDYRVYPELTAKLDHPAWSFTQEAVNEIVLWKLNRYVKVETSTLQQLNDLRALNPGEHRAAAEVLQELLSCRGVRLPMASTFLRFANPRVFQIYDRHICRAMSGRCDAISPKNGTEVLSVYWEFLDQLIDLCEKLSLPFPEADRILFEFDKAVNPPLSETQQ